MINGHVGKHNYMLFICLAHLFAFFLTEISQEIVLK